MANAQRLASQSSQSALLLRFARGAHEQLLDQSRVSMVGFDWLSSTTLLTLDALGTISGETRATTPRSQRTPHSGWASLLQGSVLSPCISTAPGGRVSTQAVREHLRTKRLSAMRDTEKLPACRSGGHSRCRAGLRLLCLHRLPGRCTGYVRRLLVPRANPS